MASSSNKSNNNHKSTVQKIKIGPDPVLLSRKEVDALYETLNVVKCALDDLGVDYIVTGGSLLGAIRQHSILFCDDDIDMAIIDFHYNTNSSLYENIVAPNLQKYLGTEYIFQKKPWEGGDRIRPKRMNNVFLDLFVLRKYDSVDDLVKVIGVKKNGSLQSEEYVQSIVNKIESCAVSQGEHSPIWPCWQFATRKAVEMWSKEVYREDELFPLQNNLKMGPITCIKGPNKPVRLLKRAFGVDCFEVYYQSASHKVPDKQKEAKDCAKMVNATDGKLPPLISAGGTWEGGRKVALQDEHYLPMQPTSRAARRPTLHCREALFEYLTLQTMEENVNETSRLVGSHSYKAQSLLERPNKVVYMDGVFDLFHLGHLEAIKQCAMLGNRVIIGVTGDADASGYKRPPIVPEKERVAIVQALDLVDATVCPCPLIVNESFMEEYEIDLVVHGFVSNEDAERQQEFFNIPMSAGKFQRIPYYKGISTTERLNNIKKLPMEGSLSKDTSQTSKNFQWFGETLALATQKSSSIPIDPFPLSLRQKIEPHIDKARIKRQCALSAIREATGTIEYDEVMESFKKYYSSEGSLESDNVLSLKAGLLKSFGLPQNHNLSLLHCNKICKNQVLHKFTKNFTSFQIEYDEFVRTTCAPVVEAMHDCDEIYYQAFPCLRIIQPNEFSIGPHADVTYGHHPCSINFYVPITRIGDTSSLFLESRPGSEDWHPIEGDLGKRPHIRSFAKCS